MTRKVILFVAEAVSIAHVARSVVLADSLGQDEFEVHFASSGEFSFCHFGRPWAMHRLMSIAPDVFLRRLTVGRPVYTESELERYVADDLKLIETVKPDAIVGDFRLSLTVSAREAGVPLMTVCNGHWSPHADPSRMSAPDLPLGSFLGFRILDPIFRAAWPLASRWHAMPMNRVKRRHGQQPYRSLGDLYCDGDWTMYADTPGLTPIARLPERHVFIGPVVWSPVMPDPEWWDEVCGMQPPPVYITLGSTGRVNLLPLLMEVCRRDKIRCIVANSWKVGYPFDSPLELRPTFPIRKCGSGSLVTRSV